LPPFFMVFLRYNPGPSGHGNHLSEPLRYRERLLSTLQPKVPLHGGAYEDQSQKRESGGI
jgi:hypothetical protein